jgi:outer membrane protein assembly factor BamB
MLLRLFQLLTALIATSPRAVRRLALGSVLGAWAMSATAGAEWNEFRGPTGDGAVTGPVPQQWTADRDARWRTELPGEGWSSPIVVHNTIYVTAAIPRSAQTTETSIDLDLCLLAVDASSGQLTSTVPLFIQLAATAPKIHSKNSHASPTPVYDGEHLYVHFGHQGTACVNLAGEVLWRNENLAYPPVHGNGGSPVVVGSLLIFSRDGQDISEVTALDKATGKIAWQTPRNVETRKRFSFCTPLVLELQGQTQLILPGSDVVQSLDPQTGREIWRVRYEGYSVIPKPIYHAGLVFISTSYDRPSLLAIDPTGAGDVTESHVRWRASSAAIPHTPSLVALDGQVAMISDKGIAAGYDVVSGQEIWKERIGGNYSASPLLVGSHMHLLSEEGEYTVLDIAGKPTEIAKSKLGERTLASPAVIHGDLILRSEKALYRIGK